MPQFEKLNMTYFSFGVVRKETGDIVFLFVAPQRSNSDITYIYEGKREYYIQVGVANLEYWKLTIEEIGEIKSEELKTMEKITTAFITETQTITETQKITHSKRWVQFGSFSSDYGTTISQVYEIPTYWWRVIWSYDSYEYGPYFEIKIFNNKTKEQLGPGHALGSPSFSSDKVGHVEGTFYFQGEGAYYFEVVAKNIKYWIIKIEILI